VSKKNKKKNAKYLTKTFAVGDFWNKFRGNIGIQSAPTTVSKNWNILEVFVASKRRKHQTYLL